MELFKAHRQWATRPADERFPDLQSLYDATANYARIARVKSVPWGQLQTQALGTEVAIVGQNGNPATMTHWAFGQLCSRLQAPASYLRGLPAELAVANLNHGLDTRVALLGESDAQMLFHSNGSLLLRAITSDSYERIWNYEVAERLLDVQSQGWEPAVPDFNSFGDKQTALYASDHDLFAFLRTKNVGIAEPGVDEPLWRGVIVENSEVGASALKATRFLYRRMCGNHIIWGASQVMDLSIRHVGDAKKRWAAFSATVRQWADESASDENAKIVHAKTAIIGHDKESVLDTVFGKRSIGLSRKTIEAGYDATVPDQDGSPKTVWGLVQGLTRHSQSLPYADKRSELDRAAGKLLEVDF